MIFLVLLLFHKNSQSLDSQVRFCLLTHSAQLPNNVLIIRLLLIFQRSNIIQNHNDIFRQVFAKDLKWSDYLSDQYPLILLLPIVSLDSLPR